MNNTGLIIGAFQKHFASLGVNLDVEITNQNELSGPIYVGTVSSSQGRKNFAFPLLTTVFDFCLAFSKRAKKRPSNKRPLLGKRRRIAA